MIDSFANLVTPLNGAEYTALKESIQARGVLVPVLVSLGPSTGRIIDGHHRKQICDELGMECPSTEREFESVEDEDAAALLTNAQRRQLNDYSAGRIYLQLMEIRGIAQGRGRKTGYTIEDLYRELGVSQRTFYRRLEVTKMMDRHDCLDIREAFLNEELTAAEALTLTKNRKRLSDEGIEQDELTSLKNELDRVRGKKISPVELAKWDGFTAGLKWAHDVLKGEQPDGDWVLSHLEDWRAANDASG